MRGISQVVSTLASAIAPAVLSSALIAGGVVSAAPILDREALEDAYVDRLYAMQVAGFDVSMELRSGGRVIIEGPAGRFEGTWSAAGEETCLFFDQGPRMGQTCGVLSADGRSIVTPDGKTLRPIARALQID